MQTKPYKAIRERGRNEILAVPIREVGRAKLVLDVLVLPAIIGRMTRNPRSMLRSEKGS